MSRKPDEPKPKVGKATHLVMKDGTEADMTLTDYQEDEDGDFTLSWTLQF